MTTFTNYTQGPRGINIQGGSTLWVEPGQTVEVEESNIQGTVPDMGQSGDAATVAVKSLTEAREIIKQSEEEIVALKEQLDTAKAEAAAAAEAAATEAQRLQTEHEAALAAAQAEAAAAIAAAQAAPSEAASDLDQTPAKLPGLTNKTKAELLTIAGDEGVTIEEGSTVADIISAIELHREANA